LLGCGAEIAGFCSASTQVLHGGQQVVFLSEKGFADLLGPLEPFVHHAQDIGEGGQRLHALIPCLALQCLFQTTTPQACIRPTPARSLNHVQWIRCRHQYLNQQGIRVERDWCSQLRQLSVGERRRRLALG
jgi:hypothetical protein